MSAAPRIFSVCGETSDPAILREAAQMLRAGGLVAFPTETVYGLGADAMNPVAIERLNAVKGRPPDKPYSWHLHSAEQLKAIVDRVPPLAQRLIDRFWPGPLTIVMPTGRGRTVGFRLPDHPIARAFLKACDVPVAAPSANRSGEPPPTDASEVVRALGSSLECVLDSGPTQLGRESTVVEVIDGRVQVLREGALSREAILNVIGQASET